MALSPMMKQYLFTKEKYKDCILFYRLGDFYEMFFDDAKKASNLLDLTLTGRDCGLEERAPMCGIPYHAADNYISKLIELGEKVAICEQLTMPDKSKNLVERDVIRVVSAGTLIDEGQLDEKKNNYILSVYKYKNCYGISYADITTGDFFANEFLSENSFEQVLDYIVKLSAAEIITNSEFYDIAKDNPLVKHNIIPKLNLYNEWAFNNRTSERCLKEQFGILTLDAFELNEKRYAISASGALIEYLKETQKHSLININNIKIIKNSEFLTLDFNAIRNLELIKTLRDGNKYGSLLWLMDKTITGMGARMLNNWILNPLCLKNDIDYRLNGTEELYNNTLIRQGLSDNLKSIKDIERLSGKVSNNNINPRDCITLGTSLSVIPSIKFQLSGLTTKIIKDIFSNLIDLSDISKLINNAIVENPPINVKDGGYIKKGYNKELDELREIGLNGKNIIAEIEKAEREKTGIKNLKIGFNRIFGYYIEITNSFKELVPYSYVRRQTLSNCERYITEELKEIEEKILGSEDKSLKIENALFNEIKEFLLTKISDIQKVSKSIGLLDCLVSLATLAKENNYCKPEILNNDKNLNIVDGRHPVVEAISKEKFVPNDAFLNNSDNRTMIITGPNMAGKSTYMRQIAIITLMAHVGSFVPAKSAEIPLTDRIFTRIGASDNLIYDQSTFMVEMTEVASILLNSTKNSLLILDEVGRGTSTYDGLSIAWAVLEYITKTINAKTLFATHYHELTELEGKIDGVKNYKITVKEYNNTIIFLRKIMRGGANKSFGIEVASLAGVPKEITVRAKNILKELEKSDITVKYNAETNEDKIIESEAEKILKEINIENVSPMQAFNVLSDLIEKIKG
jgi:DNA mismatch repair protein MutS